MSFEHRNDFSCSEMEDELDDTMDALKSTLRGNEVLAAQAERAVSDVVGLRAETTRLRDALEAIAEGNLGDLPWQADLARVSEFAREALAACPPATTKPERPGITVCSDCGATWLDDHRCQGTLRGTAEPQWVACPPATNSGVRLTEEQAEALAALIPPVGNQWALALLRPPATEGTTP